MSIKYVAYYRCSTLRQSASGLGIEAQKESVARHIATNECDLIAASTETETGKKHDLDNRPMLRKAIAHAKRSRAVLVVAKLDRLLRSTVVCALLKTSGVKFIACDQPHANELTIDILAAVAEDEVRRISQRTSAALQALKARGTLLGSHRPECAGNMSADAAAKGRAVGAQRKSEIATAAYADLTGDIVKMRSAGLSLREIAAALDAQGETTRTGKAWSATQVMRLLERAA